MTDAELLAQFAKSRCENAFAVLVRRHVHLVNSVALRHTTNVDQAEEITQAVFIILARKAHSLGNKTVLAGWLYHTARLTAANFQRAERRRHSREQEAYMESTLSDTPTRAAWLELAPRLDDAMASLATTDRNAVLLRFFENKSLQEVGKALGIEERAAQKRVSRALDRLRRLLSQRGSVWTAAVLAAALSEHSIQAAPEALAFTVSATALKGSAAAGSTLMTLVKETLQVMNWMKIKTAAALAVTTLLVASVGIAETQRTRIQAKPTQAKAQEAKQTAEQAGGAINVAPSPSAKKKLDEQKAIAESRHASSKTAPNR